MNPGYELETVGEKSRMKMHEKYEKQGCKVIYFTGTENKCWYHSMVLCC